jgi:hypothetical protein
MIILDLFESLWINLLYHGTEHDFDPRHIKPGSHFGTLKSASDRIRSQQSKEDFFQNSHRIFAFEYEPSGKMIETPDMYGDGEKASILDLAEHLIKQKILNKSVYDRINLLDDNEQAGLLMKGFLKEKGITYIKYRNKYEGIKYNSQNFRIMPVSWIIFDTENLSLVHTFKNPNEIYRQR